MRDAVHLEGIKTNLLLCHSLSLNQSGGLFRLKMHGLKLAEF